jgi:hypothetical protein
MPQAFQGVNKDKWKLLESHKNSMENSGKISGIYWDLS